LRDRHQEFRDRGARVIAIAPDSLENTRTYAEIHELPFACLPDPERAVFRLYDVKSALVSLGQRPGLFIIDRDGIVAFAHIGFQQWEIPSIDETLVQLDALT
jgi:peroxiredoxin